MKHWRAEQGQAAIEFALTAILFFTLVIFIMDGSRIFWNYLTVSEAAREGARYAIVRSEDSESPLNSADLRKYVEELAIGLDPAQLDVTATWKDDSNTRGSKVTVTVSYETRPVTSLFWPGLTLNLVDSATMVVQN